MNICTKVSPNPNTGFHEELVTLQRWVQDNTYAARLQCPHCGTIVNWSRSFTAAVPEILVHLGFTPEEIHLKNEQTTNLETTCNYPNP
jgi:hypothetical protein